MSLPRLVISGYIGDSDPFLEAMGVNEEHTSAKMVQDWLEQHKTANEIEVEIRSNGGSVTQGFNIHDLLVTSRKKVITIGHNVKSIATVIFMAGSVRKIAQNAEFLIHNPWIDPASLGNGANADLLEKVASDMRAEEERLLNFYTSKLNISDKAGKDLKKLMDRDSNMPVQEVLDWGFATEILSGATANAHTKLKVFAYSDSMLNTIKNNNMSADNKEVKTLFGEIKSMFNQLISKKSDTKNASVTIEGGDTKLWYEGDLAEGTPIFKDEAMATAADNGDYKLDNGKSITVADGKVSVVTEAAPDETAALKEQVAALKKEVETKDGEITALKTEASETAKKVEALGTKIAEFEAKHISVEPEDKNKPVVQAFAKDKKEKFDHPFGGFQVNAAKKYGEKIN